MVGIRHHPRINTGTRQTRLAPRVLKARKAMSSIRGGRAPIDPVKNFTIRPVAT